MPESPHPPKLLDQVRAALRRKHYALRTEEAYVGWIRRFILFHGTRHPRELGAPEVSAFLTHLAVESEVAASTQNQALSALLFLYRELLLQPLSEDLTITYAKRPTYLPTVLSREEARAVLAALSGTHHLMASLLYRSTRFRVTERNKHGQACLHKPARGRILSGASPTTSTRLQRTRCSCANCVSGGPQTIVHAHRDSSRSSLRGRVAERSVNHVPHELDHRTGVALRKRPQPSPGSTR
jgi:hypothetical protein